MNHISPPTATGFVMSVGRKWLNNQTFGFQLNLCNRIMMESALVL
ncbi:MAG TPA: hypothetical protein VJ372_08635 [Pyrinomonadaceae bacterium]|nr:hypothetical protein [Pyrinomonadaceae bacterium]